MLTLCKKDLNRFSDKDLKILANYYGLNFNDKNFKIKLAQKIIAPYKKAQMPPNIETLDNFINSLNPELKGRIMREINLLPDRSLLSQLRTIRNILVEDSPEYNTVIEMIMELRNAPQPIPQNVPQPIPQNVPQNVPQLAENCSNPIELISQDEWNQDNLPHVKIHYYEQAGNVSRIMCYSAESINEIINNPLKTVSRWLDRNKQNPMDSDGRGGAPSNWQTFNVLFPYTDLVIFHNVHLEEYIELAAIPLAKNVRYGNRAGLLTIASIMHGQIPGETAYLVCPLNIAKKCLTEYLAIDLKARLDQDTLDHTVGFHVQSGKELYIRDTRRSDEQWDQLDPIIVSQWTTQANKAFATNLNQYYVTELIDISIRVNNSHPAYIYEYDTNGELIWTRNEQVYANLMEPFLNDTSLTNTSDSLSENTQSSSPNRLPIPSFNEWLSFNQTTPLHNLSTPQQPVQVSPAIQHQYPQTPQTPQTPESSEESNEQRQTVRRRLNFS
jgi:hypothetical protein